MTAIELILHSLNLQRDRHRPSYDRLCVLLEGLHVALQLEGRELCLSFGRPGHRQVRAGSVAADVMLRADNRTLYDLITAGISLNEALLQERLYLCGSVAALCRIEEGWRIWLHVLTRSPESEHWLKLWMTDLGRGKCE